PILAAELLARIPLRDAAVPGAVLPSVAAETAGRPKAAWGPEPARRAEAARTAEGRAAETAGRSAGAIAEGLAHDRPHEVALLRRQLAARLPRAHQLIDLFGVDAGRQRDRAAADRDRRFGSCEERIDIRVRVERPVNLGRG